MRTWTAVSVGILCMCGTRAVNADEPRVIPLESVYSTPWQKGLKRALRDLNEPSGRDLEETYRAVRSGASNVVLVRASDFNEAVKATRLIFASRHLPILDPLSDNEGNECSIWIVVYFGNADISEPPYWVVDSIEVREQTIRVMFGRGKVAGSSPALAHHFIWAPLGKLKAGTYALELFDKDQNEVSLLRRVKLPKKGNK